MVNIEKEIKVKVNDFSGLMRYLLENGAVILNRAKETTIRLDTPVNFLEKNGVFLRVRSGSRNTITLKEKPAGQSRVRIRKETEFEIADINQMAYILNRLGFTFARTMEKFRINLKYKRAKLSIDELPFGIYLEIEGAEGQIEKIVRELGFQPEDKILVTYWDIFEEYKKKNKKFGKDIVFPKAYSSRILKV